ncbi:MAG: leucine-rich repeat domain-containing protein, partial [Chitinophagales bacterium]
EKTLFLNENILFGTQIKINGIRGLLTIPKVLFRYKETTHLNLKNNHFRTVPMQLGEFPKMTRLDLSNNYLRGVNNSMTKALALTHLDLSKNGLQNIPSILGTMKQLKWINLSNNPFSAVNTKKSGFTKAEIVKRALQKELPNCEIII